MRTKREHLAVIETLSSHVAEVPAELHDRSIEACPGWRVRDVVGHLGQVYAMVTAVVAERSLVVRRPGPEARPPESTELPIWFDERRRVLLEVLDGVEPETPCWTWADEQRAGFYFRRMAHETAVHWYDLAPIVGVEAGIDRDSAVDGIDEYFDVLLPFSLVRFDRAIPEGSLHLHCTDGNGEWIVERSSDGLRVEREHRKGTVAWRGPAADLLAAAWGRRPASVEVVGDRAVSESWSALAP